MKALLLILLISAANAKAQSARVPQKSDVFYIDEDNLPDPVILHEDEACFSVVLSSTGDTLHSDVIETSANIFLNPKGKGRFTLYVPANRSSETYTFRYDKAARNIRLIGIDMENFGNAANCGMGTTSFNLITGSFSGTWSVCVFEKRRGKQHELFVACPEIRRNFQPFKIWLAHFQNGKLLERLTAIQDKAYEAARKAAEKPGPQRNVIRDDEISE